jgi:hypothetical protein
MPPPLSDVDLLHRHLTQLAHRGRRPAYRIPAVWNSWGFEDFTRPDRGEIMVDPYRLLLDCLDRVIFPARGRRPLARRSLSVAMALSRSTGGKVLDGETRRPGGDWIRQATIYGMSIRTTSAWDHNGDGALSHGRWTETGTFLKSILLLPLLSRMGVNTLYLLPVTKISQAFRKGEIGCPYSARSFSELEPDLHDRLLEPDLGLGLPPPKAVEIEFAAFVEAAHALGIRVMVDLAPRTASRDSDLILDHPDWFYWIDADALEGYGPPSIPGYKPGIPKPSELATILRTDSLRSHLAKARPAPSVSAPTRWRRFVASSRTNPPRDLPAAIAKEFGVITPPGFSDCLNDPQPPWTDVTFLRLYLDHPAASTKHLDDPARQPPYVFTDTIKSSVFPGRRPNRPLWRVLAGILPFYQRFGVDGARVDMGHALPGELQHMLICEPKRRDADFAFLAEELNYAGGQTARRAGYNAFIGSSWYMEPRCREGELRTFIRNILPKAVLPALAAAETPDTPRSTTRAGGRRFAKMIAVLNNFLPSAVPFINSGMEVFERQPMNLGVDIQPPGRFALPRHDPYYGKLAHFDRVALHWCNAGAREMVVLLSRAAVIRQQFLADLVKPRNCFFPKCSPKDDSIIVLGWRVSRGRRLLLVVANTDFRRRRCCRLAIPRGKRAATPCNSLLEIYSGSPFRKTGASLRLDLPPGDVKVLLV